MIKISIIIPVYNAEKYLKKCIDSVINQNVESKEIILVNDGSIDNSQEIIDEYVAKYPDMIKAIKQENAGQAVARNVGIENASGEFLAFLDSDDYLEENSYQLALNKAECDDLDIVCFDYYEIINGKKEEKQHYFLNTDDVVRKYIVSETSPCNRIVKRKIFIDNNVRFLVNKIYEDLATIPTLAKYTKKIGYIPDRVYDYVIRENSTMRYTTYNSKIEDIFYAVEKLYNDFKGTEYMEELEYIYIEHLLHAASLRFFSYKEGIGNIDKVVSVMKDKFPKWRKNKYYKMQSIKYKIICELFYHKKFGILSSILGGKNA